MGGDIPRKKGPALTKSDMLVVNKVERAPHVGVNLETMAADTATAPMEGHLSLGQCARMTVLPRLVILFFMRPILIANPAYLSLRFWQCGNRYYDRLQESFALPLDRYSMACVILNSSINSVIACDLGL